ncbi:MAG: tRNA (N(6)-L-threonylcarbamoyladenosine(37)-C(2))-methylthiotransferase MtaB [Prevotellaceae bacterium]|jgi:threonylcarbamoyladenosine tRNA methylthiotransferase MtaB|nr:tRNA (N(6)-L-threonylcarbamoyladenosine(37)-C(2))-methylthiotransferase MtaB [Prevotellaceae bacterium]
MSNFLNKTFKVVNLGCKLNFAEASTIARQLSEMGFVHASAKNSADIYVVNTCAVTEQSEKKCRQAIRKLSKENNNTTICVTGCYSSIKPFEVEQMPEVNLVADKGEIAQKIGEYFSAQPTFNAQLSTLNFFSAYSSGDRTRSFLKVQDGCDYHCAYCTVPLARGASRNISVEKIVAQAQKIAAQGVHEIIITGVNIGDFGKSTNENFYQLAQALEKVEGISRYRISSIEPNLLTNEVIDFVAASQKILPHFHIPLQAGNNRVLGLMRRRYTRELFAERLQSIRKKMPLAFIGVDVIVGFPTETDEEFEDEYNFLKTLQPAYLHVFPYSKRPNTPAAEMEQVPHVKITERAKRLGELCENLHADFYKKNVGQNANVLFESTRKNGMMFGFSENYIKVALPYSAELVNKIVKVKLTNISSEGYMLCEIL